VQEAFAKGIREFDLAGDCDGWKMQWTRATRPYAWIFVFAPGLRARLIHGAKFRLVPWLRRRERAGRVATSPISTDSEAEPCM